MVGAVAVDGSIEAYLGQPEVAFQDGVPAGVARWTYPDGSIRAIGKYQHGSLNGLFTEFGPDGNLIREIDFEDGTPVVEARWLPDGTLEGMWYERAGASMLVEWFPSGAARSICEIRDRVRDGDYIELHPSGMLSASGRFSRGERSGDWAWFDKRGMRVGTQNFGPSEVRRSAKNVGRPRPEWLW